MVILCRSVWLASIVVSVVSVRVTEDYQQDAEDMFQKASSKVEMQVTNTKVEQITFEELGRMRQSGIHWDEAKEQFRAAFVKHVSSFEEKTQFGQTAKQSASTLEDWGEKLIDFRIDSFSDYTGASYKYVFDRDASFVRHVSNVMTEQEATAAFDFLKYVSARKAAGHQPGAAIKQETNLAALSKHAEKLPQACSGVRGTLKTHTWPQCQCAEGQSVFCAGNSVTANHSFNVVEVLKLDACDSPRCAEKVTCDHVDGAKKRLSFLAWWGKDCVCKNSKEKVWCGNTSRSEGHFDTKDIFNTEKCTDPYCAVSPQCDRLVPGSQTSKNLNWPVCSCRSSTHAIYCNQTKVGGNEFNAETASKVCPQQPECQTDPELLNNGRSYLKSSGEESAVAAPLPYLGARELFGQVCFQFSLALGSWGNLGNPLVLIFAINGEVGKVPETGCFRWELYIYLSAGLGFQIGNLPFRLHVQAIGQVGAYEAPLDDAKGDLLWEVPDDYDTSKCHTSDPIELLRHTWSDTWEFVKTHVMTSEYMTNAETQAQEILASPEEDEDHYAQMRVLLDPILQKEGKAFDRDSADDPTDWFGQNGGKKIQVEVKAQFDNSRLTIFVTLPNFQQISWGEEILRQTRIKVWQDVGPALLLEQAKVVTGIGKVMSRAEFQIRPGLSLQGRVELLGPGGNALLIVETPDSFTPASPVETVEFNATAEPPDLSNVPETLSVQDLSAHWIGNCGGLTIRSVDVTVTTESEESVNTATAIWLPEMFGTAHPWGVKVWGRHDSNNQSGLLSVTKKRLRLELISVDNLAALMAAGREQAAFNTNWLSERAAMRTQIDSPQATALTVVTVGVIVEFLVTVLDSVRQDLLRADPNLDRLLEPLVVFASSVHVECVERALDKSTPHEQKGDILQCAKTDASELEQRWAAEELASEEGTNGGAVGSLLEMEESKRWVRFDGRMENVRNCKVYGTEFAVESMDQCEFACDQAKKEHSGKNVCDAVTAEVEEGALLCKLFWCSGIDEYPRASHHELSVWTIAQNITQSASPSQILAGTPRLHLTEMLFQAPPAVLGDLLAPLAEKFRGRARVEWKKVVDKAFPPSADGGVDFVVVLRDRVEAFIAEQLNSDASWLENEKITALLGQRHRVEVKVKTSGPTFSAGYELAGMPVNGSRWMSSEKAVHNDQPGCKAVITSQWIFQGIQGPRYAYEPQLVASTQALFAGYDQFVSKLPSYSDQVLERLETPAPDKRWFFQRWWSALFSRSLPYSSTNGRYLHRHLSAAEQDKIKVHKGHLGRHDAVFNYPQAFQSSSMSKSHPREFWYNAGLSVANLFIRAVSDVQALFHLYVAGHPDWDGHCRTLPSQFHLFKEQSDSSTWARASNWGPGNRVDASQILSHSSKLPTHISDHVVGAQGAELSEDQKHRYKGWHWLSKPGSAEQRAAFLGSTQPNHGKDGWVLDDVTKSSSQVWPIIWCELVNSYWLEDSFRIVYEQVGKEGQALVGETKTFLQEIEEDKEQAGEFTENSIAYLRQFAASNAHSTVHNCPAVENSTEETEAGRRIRASGIIFNESSKIEKDLIEVLSQDIVPYLRAAVNERIEANPGSRKLLENDLKQIDSADRTLDKIEVLSIQKQTDTEIMRSTLVLFWRDLEIVVPGNEKVTYDEEKQFRAAFTTASESARRIIAQQHKMMDGVTDTLDTLLEKYKGNNPVLATAPPLNLVTDVVYHHQTRTAVSFGSLMLCTHLMTRPHLLEETRFEPWLPAGREGRGATLDVLTHKLEMRGHGWAGEGVELFFEKACKLPVDYFAENAGRHQRLEEARPECERMVLTKDVLTIFPSFSVQTVSLFQRLASKLDSLRENPNEASVGEMLAWLKTYVRAVPREMDADFYTAFSYRADGSLVGDLWRNVGETAETIASTLRQRIHARKDWLVESIKYSEELRTKRRFAVRLEAEKQKNISEIPAAAEGCVCEETWVSWVWRGVWPRRSRFNGCARMPEGTRIRKIPGDLSKGVCRVKQRAGDARRCSKYYSACDSSLLVDNRRKFHIWRLDNVLEEQITLPLVFRTYRMQLAFKQWNPNFCSLDQSGVLMAREWEWISPSWKPTALDYTRCDAISFYIPGITLTMGRCPSRRQVTRSTIRSAPFLAFRGVEAKEKEALPEDLDDVVLDKTDAWTWYVDTMIWLVHHVQYYGTDEGELYENWFDGSHLRNQKDAGYWNLLSGGFPQIWSQGPAVLEQHDGFGFVKTEHMVATGGTYWASLVAELIAAWQGPRWVFGFDSKEGGGEGIANVLTAGVIAWRILQKYDAVPKIWDMTLGRLGIARFNPGPWAIGKLQIAPWSHEEKILLSFRHAWTLVDHDKNMLKIFPSMSIDQQMTVLNEAVRLGVDVDAAWDDYNNFNGRFSLDFHSLNRRTLVDVLLRFYNESEHRAQVIGIIEDCPGAAQIWTVKAENTHWFKGRSISEWIVGDLPIDEELILARLDDGWYAEVSGEAETQRYIPEFYMKTNNLQVSSNFRDFLLKDNNTDLEVIERFLWSADISAVQCLLLGVKPFGVVHLLEQYVNNTCASNIPEFNSGMIPCFNEKYVSDFMINKWKSISLELSADEAASMEHIFERGDASIWNIQKAEETRADRLVQLSETARTPTSEFSSELFVSADMDPGPLFRIPGVFAQDDNGIEFGAIYDTKQVISALIARRPWASPTADSSDDPPRSDLERYFARVSNCKACILEGKAFCDTDHVLGLVSTPEFFEASTFQTITCQPKTAEQRRSCLDLRVNPTFSDRMNAGKVFRNQMCPCYDPDSGGQIRPDWVTTAELCEELQATSEIEDWRRAQKIAELAGQEVAEQRMKLSARMEFTGISGCGKGYQCCSSNLGHVQFQRCVNAPDLHTSRSLWKRMFSSKKGSCSDFKPQGGAPGKWFQADDDQCQDDGLSFEGFWSYKKQQTKTWGLGSEYAWSQDEFNFDLTPRVEI